MDKSLFSYPVSRLDEQAVNLAKEQAGTPDIDSIDFLSGFGLIEQFDGEYFCSQEALLLFAADNRTAVHPRAGVRVFTVEGNLRDVSDDEDGQMRRRLDGPLITMVEELFEYMPQIIRTSARLYSLFFREMPEYPTKAWREFIINAVAHRDYNLQSLEIEIWVYDDRIEIHSPGGLYGGITAESFETESYAHASRNPRIADVFRACGLMSETGKGIHTAKAIMAKSYLNPPAFAQTETGILVTMQNSPVFDVGDGEWEEEIRKLDLNLNQKRILIVNKGYGFSNSDYQQINNCDRDTAYREIHEIVEKGYLRCEGKGRGLKYYPEISADA